MVLTPEEREAWLARPAMNPPSGATSNFENPSSFRHKSLGMITSLLIIVTVVFAVWGVTKLKIQKKLRPEDYIIALAYVEFLVLTGDGYMMSESGLGVHMWDMTVRTQIRFFKQYYDGIIIYLVSMATLKVGIILQVLRAFMPENRRDWAWWVGHVVLWINVAFYFAMVVIELKTCTPRAKEWDPTIQEGSCIHASEVRFLLAMLNVATDLVIIALPQRVIWGLHLPFKRKLALSALFLVGILSMACGCVQIYYGIVLAEDKSDKSYKISNNGIWALPEVATGLLVACLPMLPRFLGIIGETNTVSRIGTSLRGLLGRSSGSGSGRSGSRGIAGNDVPTIGRARVRQHHSGPEDIEFETLIVTKNDTRPGTGMGSRV
ncbi:hypothetical protein CC80DRAFT_463238 [Byssothecium circinans]|uniref:Rhodopsin domain-containing protein n=1 Tax=Byssothecium circinans TaxID=147558 RepID=A0A6A5UFU8_9PLEO|nr:hypothetical protein CC80DRAFT_463238 [Byssothecium circinans]